MVNVSVKKVHGTIKLIEIKGHADSARHGQDLVCAGVSSISVGILNALNDLANDECDIQMDSGFIRISVRDNCCEKVQLILEVMLIQLLTMEESYKKYIQIQQQEVAS